MLLRPCEKCGVANKNFSKIGYVFFQLSWMVFAIILMYTAKDLVGIFPKFMQCDESTGGGSTCLGAQVLIRMSFVLACFHFVVFVVTLARNEMAALFHDGCWLVKNLSVFCFFIGCMFIPSDFFRGYSSFSRFVSVVFLIYQALLMLVVAYKINNRLVGNYEAEEGRFGCSASILLGITLLVSLWNITFLVL